MKNYLKHPNFLLGLFSFFTLILSVGMRANRYNRAGDVLLIVTLAAGFVHWVWSVIDVWKVYRADKASEDRNIFWLILVLIVPPLGGMFYYASNKKFSL